jgi:hypothetical protein
MCVNGLNEKEAIPMPDEEVLCSLTEQGNFGLGVGEVTNKKDQEAIRAMQERQKQLSEQAKKNTR